MLENPEDHLKLWIDHYLPARGQLHGLGGPAKDCSPIERIKGRPVSLDELWPSRYSATTRLVAACARAPPVAV
jgi:hypothetical protein